MSVIKLIQFHSKYYDTGGSSENCNLGEMQFVANEDDSYEYYDGDDEDGESIYNERESISFTDNIEDAKRERHLSYVPKNAIDYTIIEIELKEA